MPALPTDAAVLLDLHARILDSQPDAAASVLRVITAAGDRPAGTMRAWFEAHDGQAVDTVQVGHDGRSAWAPTGRTIDALKPSAVRLVNGCGVPSLRDYRGCRVLAASEHGLIVDTGDQVVAYAVCA